ncbi:very short patch repair endonuclease [Desulfuromonas versatilis]|uniref:very short patch repair endonuclease n=1 Tax=Desulfuromonas versatilis TaxID=2802975 RepID=UPI001C863DB2
MGDIYSREKRSEIMSRVRSTDSVAERKVRSALHRAGYRFRLHRKDLPGKPDIVLTKHKLIVFVHGCFWHRHEGCSRATIPKTNRDFWVEKFSQNVARDMRVRKELEAAGWKVRIVWECETTTGKLPSVLSKIFD